MFNQMKLTFLFNSFTVEPVNKQIFRMMVIKNIRQFPNYNSAAKEMILS